MSVAVTREHLNTMDLHSGIFDKHGRIAWLSDYSARFNGVPASDLIGERIGDIWPDSTESSQTAARIVRKTGKAHHATEWGRSLTGIEIHLNVTWIPQPKGAILAVARDLHEVDRLVALQALLRDLFRAPPRQSCPIGKEILAVARTGGGVREIAAACGIGVDEAVATLARLVR